jgi:two-component system chemotaxis sensor kinase CheA
VPNGEFFEQFIDDYYSECEEHLATVRRVLLAIDAGDSTNPDDLNQVARSLHTLKGLSGMVGLAPAEQIAHAMEETLRALPKLGGANPALVELLFFGERLLEAAIETRRVGGSPDQATGYVDEVRRIIGLDAVEPSIAGSAVALIPQASRLCRFEFIPSVELSERGVGVEVIRQRLRAIGEITATAPRVRPSGGVAFDFVVAMKEGAAPNDEWRTDGLSWAWENEIVPAGATLANATVRVDVEPQPSTAAPITGPAAANVVRVDLARLDDLMRMVGELVVTRSRLGESLARIEGDASGDPSGSAWEDVREANERIERQLRTIREGVMRIRLVPVAEVFERMRFAMRDIAREAGKDIRLEFSGQETEIDKLVVDRMLEPLLHLVRNAASHGIESPEEREAQGKPARGTIHLRAQAAGDRIILEVEDDGSGIDTTQVTTNAAARGLVAPGTELLPDTLLDVICTPGFSTRETADMASGRGIGMSVVRTTIRTLSGELFVHSAHGQGTRFTIELPLTLMITDALIVEIGDQAMAIPQVALREIVSLDTSGVTRFERNEVLSYRGRVVPLVNLGTLFKLPSRVGAPHHVLIVGSDMHLAGLVVDRILGLREIVVHPLSDPLIAVPGVAGATELADGRVSLILDTAALVRNSRDQNHISRRLQSTPHDGPTPVRSAREGEHAWS